MKREKEKEKSGSIRNWKMLPKIGRAKEPEDYSRKYTKKTTLGENMEATYTEKQRETCARNEKECNKNITQMKTQKTVRSTSGRRNFHQRERQRDSKESANKTDLKADEKLIKQDNTNGRADKESGRDTDRHRQARKAT